MTSKRTKNAAADEIDELFEGLDEPAAGTTTATTTTTTTTTTTKKTGKKSGGTKKNSGEPEKDILAELENELEDKPVSRPHTPRIKEIVSGGRGSPAPRRSGESTKSHLQEVEAADAPVPSASTAAPASGGGGGGWWGGILSTASAAMKQAEAAVKEIQQNEEAKKWADQVRGNYTVLRGYGDELRHRALPTFTNILHTLAPPIASHERLLIHITHDMVGYPSLDPLVYGAFTRVMAQVEGGDLMVVQRGHEGAASAGGGGAGWHDGPWWRAIDSPRDLGAVPGLLEGTKLCRASAEAYAREHYAAHGGLAAARQRAVEPMSETNPVRRSDLFLAVQAIVVPGKSQLFGEKEDSEDSDSDDSDEEDSDSDDEDTREETVVFAVYILDAVHEIVYHTASQALPAKWLRWLDAAGPLTPATTSGGGDGGGDADGGEEESECARVPADIRDIVESGGVDPREWAAEWVEETLSLAVGVVAQRYVARRMGVGAGGLGKGKRREDAVLADGGGEAARAGII